MAPLPPENTPRYKVNYLVNGFEHDFQLRSHESPSAIGAIINTIFSTLNQAINVTTITSVEFAADGSNVFLPVTTGVEGNLYGEAIQTNPNANWFYNFVGRTTGGRRWKLAIFGARTLGTDYRLGPSENADVTATWEALQTLGTSLVGIDDLPVNVYSYANAGVNAHWQRAVRP